MYHLLLTKMNFSGDTMLNILYQAHVSTTLNNPITFHEINIQNIKIPETEQSFQENLQKAYQIFQEHKLPRGSVDINPETWARIYMAHINDSKENNETTSQIPNGCCNNSECPIKLYYEILGTVFSE